MNTASWTRVCVLNVLFLLWFIIVCRAMLVKETYCFWVCRAKLNWFYAVTNNTCVNKVTNSSSILSLQRSEMFKVIYFGGDFKSICKRICLLCMYYLQQMSNDTQCSKPYAFVRLFGDTNVHQRIEIVWKPSCKQPT